MLRRLASEAQHHPHCPSVLPVSPLFPFTASKFREGANFKFRFDGLFPFWMKGSAREKRQQRAHSVGGSPKIFPLWESRDGCHPSCVQERAPRHKSCWPGKRVACAVCRASSEPWLQLPKSGSSGGELDAPADMAADACSSTTAARTDGTEPEETGGPFGASEGR
jgi:hypothetical protein